MFKSFMTYLLVIFNVLCLFFRPENVLIKKALILGINGQGGYYLKKLLEPEKKIKL